MGEFMSELSKETVQTKLNKIEQELETFRLQIEALYTAFMLDDLGRPSFDNHRQYHLKQVQKAQEFDSIKLDVTKKIVQSAMTLLGVVLWLGVMYWLQQNFIK
jgi:hypothetical protein